MYHMSILSPVSILRHLLIIIIIPDLVIFHTFFIYEIFILELNAGYLQHMAYDRTLNGHSAIKYKQCYNYELLTIGNTYTITLQMVMVMIIMEYLSSYLPITHYKEIKNWG